MAVERVNWPELFRPHGALHDCDNRYWFQQGQDEARGRSFVLGLIVGWATAASLVFAYAWWLA